MGQATVIDRRQERDTVIGIRHIEINARNVSEIIAVLMSLKQETAPIIVAWRGTTWIMIENKIGVFIRLGATALSQVSEARDHARWIFEQIGALLDEPGSKLR